METYADDLAESVATLDLSRAVHLRHSTGGGDVSLDILPRKSRSDRRSAAADGES
jgi:hypothetical protein